ncbi:hypothetical protein A5877_000594, partial [Enterococcus sp. 3C7_DIV0644]
EFALDLLEGKGGWIIKFRRGDVVQ